MAPPGWLPNFITLKRDNVLSTQSLLGVQEALNPFESNTKPR